MEIKDIGEVGSIERDGLFRAVDHLSDEADEQAKTAQAFNLYVIDMNGRVVLNQTSDANNSEITISNLNNLDKSIYFLKIESTTSDISITKKIIKK